MMDGFIKTTPAHDKVFEELKAFVLDAAGEVDIPDLVAMMAGSSP